MNLSGQQLEKISEALIEAFPDPSSLQEILKFQLDKNLNAIAIGNNLREIVFKLVTTANDQGWIANLICASCNSNPGNLKLDRAVQSLITKTSNHLHNRIEEKLRIYGYVDLEELGTGASGVTYLARREEDDRYIVIKTIKNEILYQKIIKSGEQESEELNQAIKAFKAEADILSKLKHRHIVSYYDHLEINFKFLIKNPQRNPDDNKFYLVRELELLFLIMEYVDGQNLEKLFANPLEEKEALRYIRQIGEALILVHNQGILHRDIKPQNIMVRAATKEALLIDFGIAREFKPMVSQTHTVAFTEGYAPPEQLEQRSKRGTYTDVYGLAATLYYLLTKTHPTPAFLRQTNSSSFQEPKSLNPSISDTVNKAILSGMELEPSKRPQTVQQWLEKLSSNLQIFEFKVVNVNRRGEITKRESKTAQYFTQHLGNNITLDMVFIPGGKFIMGSPPNEAGRYDDESPQHEVTVPSFFMGKYPVTQAQWRAVATLPTVNRPLEPNPSYFKGDNLPVEKISWHEAVEFCDRLSRYTKINYRLPSEAEWEYACRAGTTTPFHFGETITSALANYYAEVTYGDAPKGECRNKTTEVGYFQLANAFGLYDMHGNVSEWCADYWHGNYEGAPKDGRAWIEETDNDNHFRLLRGGSWYCDPWSCRSAFRFDNEPDHWYSNLGFRVVVSAART